jgi:hypothetical protein
MNITSPSTDRKILYWVVIICFILPVAEIVFLLLQSYTNSYPSYEITFPLFRIIDALFLALFFLLSPIFFLFSSISAFWIRRTEIGWHKKILNAVAFLGLLFFLLSSWWILPVFTQKEEYSSPRTDQVIVYGDASTHNAKPWSL